MSGRMKLACNCESTEQLRLSYEIRLLIDNEFFETTFYFIVQGIHLKYIASYIIKRNPAIVKM